MEDLFLCVFALVLYVFSLIMSFFILRTEKTESFEKCFKRNCISLFCLCLSIMSFSYLVYKILDFCFSIKYI